MLLQQTTKMLISRSLLCFLAAITCFTAGLVSAATLAPDEVTALQEIADKMKKTDWDFSVDPCSGTSGWFTENPVSGFDNALSCNCSFSNGTVCHVTSIVLKAQSLPGTLPSRELLKLPYLQQLDVSRNYLNGTIPPEWGASQLVNISLLGNRLTGSVPKELGNISTLLSIVLEFNQLSGELPSELGDLPNIERLLLSSNNFTGPVPSSFSKLTTLTDFRLADSSFSGQIPDFIQNWTSITKLVLQGTGLSGPIPSGIAKLTKLSDLRISDLNGTSSTFPSISNLTSLETLILRSCNIVGLLPDYLSQLTGLKVLDLSFNSLSGPIPSTYSSLRKVDYIYLTGNNLNGSIDTWLAKADTIDISYNNFTLSSTSTCPTTTENLFKSSVNKSGVAPCLGGSQCSSKEAYSLHINCGGKDVVDGKTTYEEDRDVSGAARVFESRTNWVLSNTGHFLDDDRTDKGYIAENTSINVPEIYRNARLSPISLTYYGFCLKNGNYTVKLHFAEIMFTDDKTYSSLGRRKFDIYIQGELKQKDFDIAREAGGVHKEITRPFIAIVEDGTLEIRFHWSGKGTTALPVRGVYGPLISAISVDANFPIPSEGSSISGGAIAGIVIGVLIIVLLVGGLIWWKFCLKRYRMADDLKGLDLKTGTFTLRQIKAATSDFDPANKIGEGGFGPVYKGLLLDGTIIAVKQLSSKSKQGNREFVNEIGMISALQHPHLVKLYGCCIEGNQLLLVYEYMENNSLARALFGPEETQLKLDWPTRHMICVGIARGLAYLHEESRLKIVHRDIKATNVLLDKDLTPKISDFGLAKLDEEEDTHISTRVAGTYGYMAPEYAMRGYLTDKADVYSFGIVALEIVSGRSNTSFKTKGNDFYLLDWAHMLKEKGELMDLVDPRLESNFDRNEVMVMIKVGLLCADALAANRPTMSSVVSMLEGKASVQEIEPDMSVAENEKSLKAFRDMLESGEEQSILSDSHVHTDGNPWTASTASVPDLYPTNPDSEYWDKRI